MMFCEEEVKWLEESVALDVEILFFHTEDKYFVVNNAAENII